MYSGGLHPAADGQRLGESAYACVSGLIKCYTSLYTVVKFEYNFE